MTRPLGVFFQLCGLVLILIAGSDLVVDPGDMLAYLWLTGAAILLVIGGIPARRKVP